MHAPYVLTRVAVRTAVALWRHRLAWLIGIVASLGLGAYQLSYARPSVVNGDCADTTMAAIARVDDATARAAYACLSPSMQRTSEDAFVSQLRQRDLPDAHVTRVGQKDMPDGSRIVFFTLQATDQAAGYIVY